MAGRPRLRTRDLSPSPALAPDRQPASIAATCPNPQTIGFLLLALSQFEYAAFARASQSTAPAVNTVVMETYHITAAFAIAYILRGEARYRRMCSRDLLLMLLALFGLALATFS